MLRLPNDWIWDSWIADDGENYHLFFLKAPRSLANPGRRHVNATVGHATSRDLREWDYRGQALAADRDGWDDVAIWTGSIARGDDGVWRMYYTGLSATADGALTQSIGLAESDDLDSWRRFGSAPLLEADPRWYQTLTTDPPTSETWRDPFVFRDPDGDGWHMVITARARDALPLSGGVLAHARSADMRKWEVGPPLSAPAGFSHLEVPQVRLVDRQPLLVFTCHPQEQSSERQRHGSFDMWTARAESMTGPWDLTRARSFVAEPDLFAAPLVQDRDGGWSFIGFRNLETEGIDSFEITDPVPVQLVDGELIARTPPRH
jgi:beta-fructofuranosidase